MTRSSAPSLSSLLRTAVDACRAAGVHALNNTHRREEAFHRSAHDVKLLLDRECQAIAREVIHARFPHHAVTGEEEEPSSLRSRTAEIQWVVDPIDGTVNFSHGLPFWCCSVAALRRGQTLAGAVYAPILDLLFTAARGQGARCNRRLIRVSRVRRPDEALVLTGADLRAPCRLPPFAFFEAFASTAQRVRILGSAALDLCRVALGEADVYFESGIFLWDVAAARLMVTEAGGRAAILRRFDNGALWFLASNRPLFEPFRKVVQAVAAGEHP